MKKILKIILLTVACSLGALAADKEIIPDLEWREISDIGFDGQAWSGEEYPFPYARIPLKFKGQVTKNVWNNSLTPTGLSVTFETNSNQIWIDCEFREDNPAKFWFANSGFDLYASDGGKFRWLATTPISKIKSGEKIYKLSALNGKENTYRVYLPLRNIIKSAKIGVQKGATFKRIVSMQKPIVFYGTSIVHGAWAFHSGISHPSLIGRRLNKPIINLGFSGSAQMEIGMAEMLATIDAELYFIDATQNMNKKLIEERCKKFLKRLRELRPDTPIVVAEEATSATAWYWQHTDGKPYVAEKCQAQRAIVRKLQESGFKELYYIDGEWLFGEHGETSPDNCHPGDIGMMNMADKFTPVIEKILKRQ